MNGVVQAPPYISRYDYSSVEHECLGWRRRPAGASFCGTTRNGWAAGTRRVLRRAFARLGPSGTARDDVLAEAREFLAVAGDGECELLQVLEMEAPPEQPG